MFKTWYKSAGSSSMYASVDSDVETARHNTFYLQFNRWQVNNFKIKYYLVLNVC